MEIINNMKLASFSRCIDSIILWILVLSTLIFRYLGLTSKINVLLIFLIFVSVVLNCISFLKDGSLLCIICIVGYFFYNFYSLGGSISVCLYNLSQVIPSFLAIIYVFNLLKRRKDFLLDFLNQKVTLFNIYMYISIPFILLQANGQYWLAGNSNGAVNPLGIDLICGLFGFNGTPMMALFVAFAMVLNFDYYCFRCKESQKSLFLLLVIPLFIFYSVLPLFNDNKGYYIVLLLFFFLYFVSLKFGRVSTTNHFESYFKRIGIVYLLIAAFIAVSITLLQIEPIRITFEKMQKEIMQGWEYGSRSHGSNERIGMIQFGLQDSSHVLKGYGIGQHTWTEPYLFGFWHYGQSDFGTFLCLGGVALLIILFFSIFISFTGIVKSFFLSLLVVVSFVIMSIYTQLFTVISLTVSLLLMIILCIFRYSQFVEGN